MNGWALCNGQLLPISQNTALFAILGTQYGGNGTTNFALPNLMGSSAIHQGSGAGLSPVSLGEARGTTEATVEVGNLPLHTHALMATASGPTTHDPTLAALASLPRNDPPIYAAATPSAVLSPQSLGLTGGGQPFTHLQPYLVLNFVIALQGIFPSRN